MLIIGLITFDNLCLAKNESSIFYRIVEVVLLYYIDGEETGGKKWIL